jgi:hypothetical protein
MKKKGFDSYIPWNILLFFLGLEQIVHVTPVPMNAMIFLRIGQLSTGVENMCVYVCATQTLYSSRASSQEFIRAESSHISL